MRTYEEVVTILDSAYNLDEAEQLLKENSILCTRSGISLKITGMPIVVIGSHSGIIIRKI